MEFLKQFKAHLEGDVFALLASLNCRTIQRTTPSLGSYIDYLYPSDMKSRVSYHMDNLGRPAISLLLICKRVDTKLNKISFHPSVLNLFQRYITKKIL